MGYDFSMLQRVEDRIQEDRLAAERHRLAKRARAEGGRSGFTLRTLLHRLGRVFASVPAALGQPGGSGRRRNGSRKAKKPAIIAGAALITVASVAGPAQGQAPAPSLATLVRNIAESVLGEDTVKLVKLADSGRTVLIRWESATYRPHDRIADTREILYGEALLATTAVLSQMRNFVRIKFTMVQGTRMLATGVNHRGRGLSLVFSPELGGGRYDSGGAAEDTQKAPGTGASLQTR